ncbi:chemotaxis protein CheA [Scytonema millei]|uniref:histidine kinase n=1 Tax=Scytonema millei VB511283 TaxID=1245923 RepID=A0A9X5E6B0_9CYAN|nr:chemotaxis protein CheA [Scytonema millei]NHC35721.1 chemotaxis protein CheA [Scytonema millei VB511283]
MESLEIDDDIKAFLDESYENLNQIEQVILDLEGNSANSEHLTRIYRALHTIKGNCGFLPLPKLESVAHAGENLLGKLREQHFNLNPQIASTLLQTVDAIRQILTQVEATGNEGDGDYAALIAALQGAGVGNRESGVGGKRAEGDKGEGRAILATSHQSLVTDNCQPSAVNNQLPTTDYQLPTTNPSDSTIRVNVELLDRVMNLVGELVLARNQMVQFAETVADSDLTATCQRLNRVTAQLQEEVLKTRMQPIATIWQKFPRVVRDLAIASGKQVQVEMNGADTELDRTILEAIKDPLTHIVRNCIAHGIETPEIRSSRGKSIQGKLALSAWHEGGTVKIEISDDGNGIDPQQLKQQAQKLGILSAVEAEKIGEAEALNLIFVSGFSTAAQVTNLSGRGVGMDVVKTNLAAIDGTVEVNSQVEQGTKFKLKIPLTLAIIPALVVYSGNHRFAIPQASIQELEQLEVEASLLEIETFYDIPVYRLRGKLLPLVYLNQTLQLQAARADAEIINIVVINADNYYFGLVIDEIQDIQDIVVKPLGKQLRDVSAFAGATILGDGKIAFIIDAVGLANCAGVTSQLQQQLAIATATVLEERTGDRQSILLFHGGSGARMGLLMSQIFRLEEFDPNAVEIVADRPVVQYRNTILPLIYLDRIFGNSDFPESRSPQPPLPRGAKSPQLASDVSEGQSPQPPLSRGAIFPQSLEREGTNEQDDKLQVIVVELDRERSLGLVVECILDIVEEPLAIAGHATRSGILYLAAIQGQVTEILDLHTIVQIVYPYLLQSVNC